MKSELAKNPRSQKIDTAHDIEIRTSKKNGPTKMIFIGKAARDLQAIATIRKVSPQEALNALLKEACDRENEIINVPMPRNVARRLADQSFSLISDMCRIADRGGTDEKTIASAIAHVKGTDSDECVDESVEEYRLLRKALAAEEPTSLTLDVDGFKIELTPDCTKRLEAAAASSKMTPAKKFQDIVGLIALAEIV